MPVPHHLFKKRPAETLVESLLTVRKEIQPRHTLLVSFTLDNTTQRRRYTATAVARQHEDPAKPRTQILSALQIELSKRGRAERCIPVVRDPCNRKLVMVQVCSEFFGAIRRGLMREDVRPMLKQPRYQLGGELRSFCEVADLHGARCPLTPHAGAQALLGSVRSTRQRTLHL